MNTLVNLLPGLRDVRAPLAAGYLWLLTLWLFYGGETPDQSNAGGLVDRVYDLEGVVSEFGLIVAVSFVAYLVGTLTEWTTTSTLQRLVARSLASWFDEYLRYEAETAVLEHDGDKELIDQTLESVRAATFTTSERRDELAAIRSALKVTQPVLFDDYDRLRAEAEFRSSIVVPLSCLVYILGSDFDTAFYLGFAGIAALIFQALHYETRATSTLIQSVINEKVKPQFVEQTMLLLSTRQRRYSATSSP